MGLISSYEPVADPTRLISEYALITLVFIAGYLT